MYRVDFSYMRGSVLLSCGISVVTHTHTHVHAVFKHDSIHTD
jgi:hypothetical protein